MKSEGFSPVRCGLDGPQAWAVATVWNERWQRHRQGREQDELPKWPAGSIGEAFERYKKLDEWQAKSEGTREEWELEWSRIAPVFGDLPPTSAEITLETLSRFRRLIAETVSLGEAWRVIKIWRALWNVCAALGYCAAKTDPSLAIRNTQPKPRSASWSEGEAVRIAKQAWRKGYLALAVAIAIAWDTQFSPVDVRRLTPAEIAGKGKDRRFDLSRAKTGRAAIGTLSKRTLAMLDAYLALHPCEVGAILRNRSGTIYSKWTLPDDFAVIREQIFPGDKRRLADMRRSGALELAAGQATPGATAAKMANSIETANVIHKTYQPVNLASVRLADDARKAGRQRIRENKSG